MRIFLVIVFLSVIALVPDVRHAVSSAIADTRDSLFSNLSNKSRINRKAQQRQRLELGTPASAPDQAQRLSNPVNIAPVRPSTSVNVSDELRQNRWITTKEIFY